MGVNIRLLSDLHTEFDFDHGRGFCEQQDPTGVDVLILAGDIVTEHNEIPFEILSKKFKNILYVLGNHDHWRKNWQKTFIWASQLETKYPGVRFLNNNIVELYGQRFLGTTLWTTEDPKNKHLERLMNDFWMIEGGASQFIYSENKKAVFFLEDNVIDGDVVITHHLPSWDAISDYWKGSNLNCFFANDLDHILYDKEATFLFGHTHDSTNNKKIGRSTLYCNPRGYTPSGLNREFNPKMIIGV